MSEKLVVAGLALGLFVLLAAFAIPPAIDATNNRDSSVHLIDVDETVEVTPGLEVTVEDSTNSQSTLLFTDVDSGLTHNTTIQEGATQNFTLDNEFVEVTLQDATNADAQIRLEYAHTYGWAPGAKTLAEQMDVVLVLFAFVVVLGSIGAVIS